MKTKTYQLTFILTFLLCLGCTNNSSFEEADQIENSVKNTQTSNRQYDLSNIIIPENPLFLEITWENGLNDFEKMSKRSYYHANIGLVGYQIIDSSRELWIIDDDAPCYICSTNGQGDKADYAEADDDISNIELADSYWDDLPLHNM